MRRAARKLVKRKRAAYVSRPMQALALLREWMRASFGEEPVRVIAYGDSAGDNELLAMADVPVRISRRRLPAPLA